MDPYIKRMFRRKIPVLIVVALALLISWLAKICGN